MVIRKQEPLVVSAIACNSASISVGQDNRCSWYCRRRTRTGKPEYARRAHSGAVFFDQERSPDRSSALPHTLPSPWHSPTPWRNGNQRERHIVVYDGPGIFSPAPSVWWMFRIMGAQNVFGSRWRNGRLESGRPADDDEVPKFSPQVFQRSLQPERGHLVRAHERCGRAPALVRLPMRAAPGALPERTGTAGQALRSGHMPGARSLPFGRILRKGQVQGSRCVRRTFAEAGIDLTKPVVTSCGSGITAAIITLALQSLDMRTIRFMMAPGRMG